MRIAYCTNIRLPSERAHGHQVAQVCAALGGLGHTVEIYAPYRTNPIKEAYAQYHGDHPNVTLVHLGTFDPIAAPWLFGVNKLWVLNWLLRRSLPEALGSAKPDLVYTRTPALLQMLVVCNTPVVLELHRIPRRGLSSFVSACNRCVRVVCLTQQMGDALQKMGVSSKLVIVEPDGVKVELFSDLPEHTKARNTLGVPEGFVVGYTGQLESMGLSKGIPELLDALSLLKKEGRAVRGLIAGGPQKSQEMFASNAPSNLRDSLYWRGSVPHKEIPGILAACDVLVYPAPKSSNPFYLRDTSPLKLFEYMASGRPIVTADLPTTREILSEDSAVFCKPGDAADLARAIAWVMDHPEEARTRAERAKMAVDKRSWEKRMSRIIASLPV